MTYVSISVINTSFTKYVGSNQDSFMTVTLQKYLENFEQFSYWVVLTTQ